MTVPAENALSLDDVLAFNDVLMAYAATGLPVELAAGDTSQDVLAKLQQLNARLALRTSRGESLEEVLKSETHATPRYRAALESWLRGQQPIEALDALAVSAQGRREVEAAARYSLVQPLIVLALVYAGFIFLLLNVMPKLQRMYEQMWQAPGAVLSVLLVAKRWLPVWGPTVPLLILILVLVWCRTRSPLAFNWLPGRTKYLDALHKANYADSVARLLDKQYSLGQALALLGPLPTESTRDTGYAAATNRLIEAETLNQPLAFDDPAVRTLPPLLRWAFAGDRLGQPLPEVLRIAAQNYRALAQRYSFWTSWWMPTLTGALVGGVVVLAFAVSLFWPMIELLQTLTRP